MITTAVLYLLYYMVYIITYPLTLFADVSADSTITSAVTTANSYLAFLNPILPMSTVWLLVALILATEVIIMGYKLIMWVVRRIPGQG